MKMLNESEESFLGVFELCPPRKFGLEIGAAVIAAVMVIADQDVVETSPEGFPLVLRNLQSVQIPSRLIDFVLGSPITAIKKGSSGSYYICINKAGETIAVEKHLWETTVKQKLQRVAETTSV